MGLALVGGGSERWEGYLEAEHFAAGTAIDRLTLIYSDILARGSEWRSDALQKERGCEAGIEQHLYKQPYLKPCLPAMEAKQPGSSSNTEQHVPGKHSLRTQQHIRSYGSIPRPLDLVSDAPLVEEEGTCRSPEAVSDGDGPTRYRSRCPGVPAGRRQAPSCKAILPVSHLPLS